IVADTGVGIPDDALPRLFERFHRVEGQRSRSFEGSGIGLALVQELVKAHGGTIKVESEIERGTRFKISLPFGVRHLPADQLRSEPARHIRPARAEAFVEEALRWLPEKAPRDEGFADRDAFSAADLPAAHPVDDAEILVADDNADMRDYLAGLLSAHYDVELAADGQAALERATVSPPDVVLTDVMMPRLDGFGLLRALRSNPATVAVPIVMMSARAGEEGVIEGLEAGADDYLVKPFAARELLARVRNSLELDRSRRTQQALQHQRALLDQAQRLANLGSWELQLPSGRILASDEFLRIVGVTADQLNEAGLENAVLQWVHPDDRDLVARAVERAVSDHEPFTYDLRLATSNGERIARIRGEAATEDGRVVALRGSMQDITEQRRMDEALAAAAASREAAAREHLIADQLQRSLLPARDFDPDQLDVSTYYRAGVAGTQVGGDWYDVIRLGAGRTAVVIGDVMGRGVAAAAIMGQLRSATRAFAHLDLPPADVLEQLDGVVRDLGDDQLVTCIYAVYDPYDRSLSFANAGHMPPLLLIDDTCEVVGHAGPPLGSGPVLLRETEIFDLPPGALITLYTDGLVEHRTRDIEEGIGLLADALRFYDGSAPLVPEHLVAQLLPDGPSDDIAILMAKVPTDSPQPLTGATSVESDERAVHSARNFVATTLAAWDVHPELIDDVVLCAGELVTNAILHGNPPIALRLRHSERDVVLQVHDSLNAMPRRIRPREDDEHGRGLQIVRLLASEWGIRPTAAGKSVWCAFSLGGRPPV
ncbi:MAG TPA: SpoIIE family protein phosphatase, partial [Mycobacteriales bacterium]|nr:SpoIIE family protein phosphatase [Mycobacteriales bacterium]